MALSPELRKIILNHQDYFIEALDHTKNRLLDAKNHDGIKEHFPIVLQDTIKHYVEKKINFTINKIKTNDESAIYVELDGYEDVLKSALHVYLQDIKKSHEYVKQTLGFMPTTNQVEQRILVLSQAFENL